MPDFAAAALRLYRRLVGAPSPEHRHGGAGADPGVAAAATGAAAVAVVEAAAADAAAVEGSWPAAASGLRYRSEAAAEGLNLLGRRTEPVEGGLAAAVGLAAAGERAAAFVASPDLERRLDLLATAAARRLPLVVHLACRAGGGSGAAAGGGHGAVHGAAAAGAVTLFAATVQEAVDLALAGRRLAEAALVPVVVACDGAETALTVQDLHLPSARSIERFLGRPGDVVHAPTPGQEAIFGRHRRRLPRRHDPARPAATGGPLGAEAFALAAASRQALLDDGTAELLGQALAELGRRTGRRLSALGTHRIEGAEVALVAMGAAIEVAEAVADVLAADGRRVGVIGVRALRPFPEAALIEALEGCRVALVLERTATPPAADGPLTAAVRGAVGRALENGRHRHPVHPGLPALADRKAPTLLPVGYGLGGAPLRAADLAALCREADRHVAASDARARDAEAWTPPRWLGLDLAPAGDAYPKRRALLDRLRRDVPALVGLGLRTYEPIGRAEAPLGEAPAGGFTVAFHRLAGAGGEGLAADAAVLLHRLAGGALRGRAGSPWARSGPAAAAVDRLTWSPEAACDPGDGAAAELALWRPEGAPPASAATALLAGLRPGGALLLTAPETPESAALGLPPALAEALAGGRVELFAVPAPAAAGRGESATPTAPAGAWRHEADERLLGALFGVLAATGRIELAPRRLIEARRELLSAAGIEGEAAGRRLADLQAGFEKIRRLTPEAIETVARRSEGPARPVIAPGLSPGTGKAAAARPAEGRASSAVETAGDPGPPAAARRAAAATGGDGLAALWDRAGVLYRRGESDALAAEPLLAAGSLPPASSALAGPPPERTMLPAFDPAACTGSGACWTACPEGAVVPAAAAPSDLIDLGLRRAREAGRPADALRMVAGKLAAGLGKALASPAGGAGAGGAAGILLDAAFEPILLGVPAARREAVSEVFAAVREALAPLPLAGTAPYLDAAEAGTAGSGAALVIAVDPDACTGCGLCVAACAFGALSAVADDAGRSAAAGTVLELAAALPAPTRAVLERVRRHPASSPLAAALLPPAARAVVWGGGGAEAGSGEAVAVRQALGVAAGVRDAERRRLAEQVAAVQGELSAAIHRSLEQALPDADLEALAAGLEAVERPDADLAELTARVEGALEGGRVEVPRLRRLVAAARELADLALGPAAAGQEAGTATGTEAPGAAPFGVVIAGAAPWAGAFPYNALAVPATYATAGEAADLARGLATGQVRQTLEALRALRRAKIELERPAEAARAEDEIARLAWSDLDPAERRLCPPLVVIGAERSLSAGEIADLLALAAGELPVKLLLLAEADPGPGNAARAPDPWTAPGLRGLDPALAALTLPGAGVAQTSIAHPDHLEAAVAAAFAVPGPALLRLLAPSPGRGGFAADRTLERAREVVASGAFPLFRRDPEEEPAPLGRGGEGVAAALRRLAAAVQEAMPPAGAAGEASASEAPAPTAATVPPQPAAAPAPATAETDARLAALARDYEARLARQRAEMEAETSQRVRRRLLALLTAAPPSSAPSGEARPEERP